MTEPPILQRVIDELNLNTTTDQLARRVTAIPIPNAQLVNVTVLDPNASLATRIANTLSSDFVDQVTQVTQQNDQRIKAADAPYEDQYTTLTNIVNNEVNQLAKTPRVRTRPGSARRSPRRSPPIARHLEGSVQRPPRGPGSEPGTVSVATCRTTRPAGFTEPGSQSRRGPARWAAGGAGNRRSRGIPRPAPRLRRGRIAPGHDRSW